MKHPSITSQLAAVQIAVKVLNGASTKPRGSALELLMAGLDAAEATLLAVAHERARDRAVDGDGGQE